MKKRQKRIKFWGEQRYAVAVHNETLVPGDVVVICWYGTSELNFNNMRLVLSNKPVAEASVDYILTTMNLRTGEVATSQLRSKCFQWKLKMKHAS